VRAPNWDAKEDLLKRVVPCFEFVHFALLSFPDWIFMSTNTRIRAAATATKCLYEATVTPGFYELLQNKALGNELFSPRCR
jgi:hypothetical protein